ncbi:MAG: hypothetical protein AB3N20_19750 [Rhizobiaceae bacterium]
MTFGHRIPDRNAHLALWCGRRRIWVAPVLVLCLLVSACGTTTIEEAVPQEALQENTVNADEAIDQSTETEAQTSGGPDNSGEFPNLNRIQRGALEQMTPAEKEAFLARLQAARAEQAASGSRSNRSTSQGELEQIARTHDGETLKEIESEPDKTEEDE